MKRRSFLISACVIALVAVLAGCSDAVVYPEFPTGGFITQKGDFLEGQKLDSTKFEVTATYTNGATKTLTGVSIQDSRSLQRIPMEPQRHSQAYPSRMIMV